MVLRPGPADEPEVLLIERPASMAFGPGLHAFPGGKVDPSDADPSADAPAARTPAAAARVLGGNESPVAALALHRAVIRELHEEAGIRLAGTDRLAPIAHWTTPAFMPRRFSTWFFVADLPPGAELTFEADEVAGHAWLTPSGALDHLADGRIEMWVPTTSVLQRLIEIGAGSAADVGERIRIGAATPPRIVSEDAEHVRFAFGGAGALPGRACETQLLGRRDLVVVDPGDPSEAAIRAIDDAAARRGGTIRAVVLTASDPDHAAGAEAIAIPHGVPIVAAPGAGRHLPYAVRSAEDGERLPADVNALVRLGPAGSGRLEVVTSAGQ